MPYQPIEDYGVIGDLRTAALSKLKLWKENQDWRELWDENGTIAR